MDPELQKLIEQTSTFGSDLKASAELAKQALDQSKTVEAELNKMRVEMATANEDTKKNITDAFNAKMAEFEPKLAELQKFSQAAAAAAERAAAAGSEKEKEGEVDVTAAAKSFIGFVLASRSGDDGKFETPEVTEAMVAAHQKYERVLASALFHNDRMQLINANAAINRDPVAAGLFAAGYANLTPVEAERINIEAASMNSDMSKRFRAGMTMEQMQRAGMFSPSTQAPEFQMPAVFGEMLKCFNDPTDIAGMVFQRNITKRRYRQWRETMDLGEATWECENECQPSGSDPIPLPIPQDGQVYGLSSHVCIHIDDLEDRDRDWGQVITSTLAQRMRRTVGKTILFGDGKGRPQGLANGITQFNLATSPSPLAAGAFIDWVNIEIGANLLKNTVTNPTLYGNRAGYTHLATTRNAFSDRANVIRFGADGTLYVGSYKYSIINYLPEGSNPQAVGNPMAAQKVNFILGDLKQAYHLVIRKEAGISRHEPVNGGTCVAFLARARLDGYIACANAAVAFKSP